MTVGPRGRLFAVALGVSAAALAVVGVAVGHSLTGDGAGGEAARHALRVGLSLAGVVALAAAAIAVRLVGHAPGRPSTARPPSDGDDAGGSDRVRRERDRLRAVLESMGDAVLALDADLTVTLMNPAARDMLGREADAIGRPLLETIRAPALHDLLRKADDGDHGDDTSSEFDLPGSNRRVLAVLGRPQRGAGIVLVLHDVTTLRRLETIRRDFVANVSHELRTPISIISANTETLLAGALEDHTLASKLIDAIDRNADRLRALIEDLLDLSRLEAGKYELEVSPVDLAELCSRAVDAVGAKIAQRGTQVAIDLPDGLCALAAADGLLQVVVNLLDNAVKYTQAGSHVVVAGRTVGDRVRLEVSDDGPGIAPHLRERIFERFYRIDPGRAREMGGTGLGLSIVKHIVETMNGQVGVDRNRPHGSVFWIELPAAPEGAAVSTSDRASEAPRPS